jgi:hypothetical protein
MMDIAATLDYLVPAAQYRGSLTANTEDAYTDIEWQDARPKPTWAELQAAWPAAQRASFPIQTLLDSIIAEGEAAMALSPLPEDIQEQVYDLRALIMGYPPGKTKLVRNKIQAFTIPADRLDVSANQRGMVDQLKNQMLQLFPEG